MNFKTVAAVGTAIGIFGVGSAFATFARIESMGKNTTYIMDDVSIFHPIRTMRFETELENQVVSSTAKGV